MSNESLKTLHTALIDAKDGYVEAEKDAENGALKSLFREMIDLHQRAHEDVHALLVEKGEKPDERGSFMSTVHETVIAVRSAVTGLDHGALSSFASGEERIVKTYDDAIKGSSGDTSVIEILNRRRTALLSKIAEMKRLSA